MGQKIKHRQERKPRHIVTRDMILSRKGIGGSAGGPMRHKGDRRPKDKRREREFTDE